MSPIIYYTTREKKCAKIIRDKFFVIVVSVDKSNFIKSNKVEKTKKEQELKYHSETKMSAREYLEKQI